MAEALHDSATKQVSDILELLQTGEYWITFRKEGRGRLNSLDSPRRQHMRKGTRKVFAVFAKTLYLRDINSCIAGAASSVDTKREMSYRLFYQKRFHTSPNAPGMNFTCSNQILCGLNLLANRLATVQ